MNNPGKGSHRCEALSWAVVCPLSPFSSAEVLRVLIVPYPFHCWCESPYCRLIQFRARTARLLEDPIGGLGPCGRLGIVVVILDVIHDRGLCG